MSRTGSRSFATIGGSGDTPRPRRGTLLITSFALRTRSENRRRLRCATPPLKPQVGSHRISLKQLRTSRMNISGCSNAAKCPPLVSSLKYTTLANLFSAHRRDVRNISLGKIEQPTGMVTGSDIASAPRKLSQYKRAEDAAFAEANTALRCRAIHRGLAHSPDGRRSRSRTRTFPISR